MFVAQRSPFAASVSFTSHPRRLNADKKHQSPLEKGYNLDDMNDKGAFNYSCICIVPTVSLVEPSGWFSGRRYYVVLRGRSVGVFHEL